MRTVWDIIKSPVITEKALVAKEESQDRRQLLTFRVDQRATKPEIKNAVETIFQVKVDQVRTAQYLGKMARRGRQDVVRRRAQQDGLLRRGRREQAAEEIILRLRSGAGAQCFRARRTRRARSRTAAGPVAEHT